MDGNGAATLEPAVEAGLSGGSWILIIFFSIFVLYCCVGAIVVRTGCISWEHDDDEEDEADDEDEFIILPHQNFWLNELPLLIVDGMMLTFCCKRPPPRVQSRRRSSTREVSPVGPSGAPRARRSRPASGSRAYGASLPGFNRGGSGGGSRRNSQQRRSHRSSRAAAAAQQHVRMQPLPPQQAAGGVRHVSPSSSNQYQRPAFHVASGSSSSYGSAAAAQPGSLYGSAAASARPVQSNQYGRTPHQYGRQAAAAHQNYQAQSQYQSPSLVRLQGGGAPSTRSQYQAPSSVPAPSHLSSSSSSSSSSHHQQLPARRAPPQVVASSGPTYGSIPQLKSGNAAPSIPSSMYGSAAEANANAYY